MVVKQQIPNCDIGRTTETAGDNKLGPDQQQEGPQ